MEERVAIVTGSSEGIGLAIVAGLARRGIRTVLTGRKLDKAVAAAAGLGDAKTLVTPRALDVTDPASRAALMASIEKDFGRLDILVNNAGINIDGNQTPSQVDFAILRTTFETNFFGAWAMSCAALPLMRRHREGRIVNVSSGMGALTEGMGPNWPAYRTSKTALNALTRTLAAELAGSGILVNSACPGWVRTRLGGQGAPLGPEEGADTPVWLATLPADGPTGGFFRGRKPAAW